MKVTESVARLAILAIVLIVVVVAGCDRAMTVGKTVMPDPTEEVTPAIDLLSDWPGEDTTDEERNRWWEAVDAAAVNVNLLNISGCTPDPLVIEVENGESIQIYNDDATDHTLTRGNSITVPAFETINIVISDFLETGEEGMVTPGAYNYVCDGVWPSVGIFYVVEPQVEPPPINPLLVFPGEDWTEEESERWWEVLFAAAVNVNLLNISGCTPDPLVMDMDHGESIQIYNHDLTDHTLHWGGNIITIPAGDTIDIVVSDVFPTTGAIGYSCDDGPTAGIFLVHPPPSE